MALTKISTGGVKDDAITAGKIPANAVGSSEIANNAIEGNHIGDGEIAAGKLASNSVTSAKIVDDSVNSEHIAAGAVDLEHMSSESVDEDNLKISNAGTNGQYLQKQSGNTGGLTWADVNANGIGNHFTATADGALPTNKPVKINSNGKVSEIKATLQTTSLNASGQVQLAWIENGDEHYSGANTGDPRMAASVYDPNSNKVFHLWHGPNNHILYKIGTITTSTGAISWAGVNTSGSTYSRIGDSTSEGGNHSVTACWHPTRNRVVAVYRQSGSPYKARMYFADISSADGSTTPTWSGPHTISDNVVSNRMYIQHDPDADRLVFSYQSSDNNAYIKVIDVASDLSITQGTEVQINNSGSGEDYYGQEPTICYDTNRDKWSIIYKDAGTRDLRGKVGTVTASGNSISLSSEVVLDTGENFAITQVFDPNTNKICIVHRTSSTFYARLGEISSSGTLSVGSTVTMAGNSSSSTVGESDYGPGRVAMVYLAQSSKVVGIVPTNDGSSTTAPRYCEWTTTGSTPSIALIASPGTVITQQNTTYPWVGVAINQGMVCWTWGLEGSHSYGGDNRPYNATTSVVAITPNLSQAGDVVGWPKQAYSDGDTATILTDGNVKSGLSGLTIGNSYYIKKDGTIATSTDFSSGFLGNTPYAGRAIASDKIIIGHPYTMNGT